MIMTPRIMLNRLEISFWNTVIPLMEQSTPIRFIIYRSYMLASKAPSTKLILLGLSSVISGGLLGFLLGVLRHYL
jgi:hypothetical protein